MRHSFPQGIVSVLQTPFQADLSIDETSLVRLIDSAITAGAAGFLAPAVASEVGFLSKRERERLLELIPAAIGGRVPFIAGASSENAAECAHYGKIGAKCGAQAWLVAIPEAVYANPSSVLPFVEVAAAAVDLPLVVQDLQWNGPGLSLKAIAELAERIPQLAGIKIETVPAGPKYSQVRAALGDRVWIAGGWAAPQMIEALDRGVDAMIPESSMVAVYRAVYELHRAGDRRAAIKLFRELLPVLAFANQEIRLCIGFFKRLLVEKRIFTAAHMRAPFEWDEWNGRIAGELIGHYMALEEMLHHSVNQR